MNADILVAGGGCVGSLAAALFAKEGFRVVLASPQKALSAFPIDAEPVARVIALAPDIEDRLAVEGAPAQPWLSRGCAVNAMHVAVPGGGEVAFGDGHQALARIVEVPAMQYAFEQWAAASGVRRIDEAVTNLTGEGVELESGVRIRAPLILASDGADSLLRRQLAVEVSQRDYGQTAIVARMRFAKPHQSEARQTMSGSGVLGVLPLVDGSVSVVWSLPDAAASHWLRSDEQTFAEGLSLALGAPWGEAQLLGKRHAFPLRNIHSQELFRDGVCLLGDAAHTVHPLAGLGLNLGLADTLTLVAAIREIQQHKRDLGDAAILRRWSRQRVTAVAPYRQFIDALGGLGVKHRYAWQGVGFGFSLVKQAQPVRQFFEQRARRGSLPANF